MDSEIKWISFKDKLPEKERLIIFGNHRMTEIIIYHPDHPRIKKGKLEYKDITHWCYLNPPPPIERDKDSDVWGVFYDESEKTETA